VPRRLAPLRGEGALAVCEQPPGEARAALERLCEAVDLQQVEADTGHGAGRL
jgi:hypothetical protein